MTNTQNFGRRETPERGQHYAVSVLNTFFLPMPHCWCYVCQQASQSQVKTDSCRFLPTGLWAQACAMSFGPHTKLKS